MSTPSNPLAKFSSYNYYHVLVICDSSATAFALSSQTDINVWQHTSEDADPILGGLAPQSIQGAGRYSVLINGSTDAALSITKATWTSATAASAVTDDANTSIAIEGSMSISEPKGILFLDKVVRCCVALGIDSSSAVWALKTFFVGYNADTNSTQVADYISDVSPIVFLAYDITGSFSESGGIYDLSFVALAHGAARLPQFSKSAMATNFKGGTLKSCFANLTNEVNANYGRYYACMYEQVAKTPDSAELLASLRPVEYSIRGDSPYDNEEIYTVTDQSAQAKNKQGCAEPATNRIDPNVSIEQGIHQIMAKCKAVKTDASDGINGVKYTYKIHASVESTPTITNNKTTKIEYKVFYIVKRIEDPHSISFSDVINGNIPDMDKNVIFFDYLYTGKNIDIIEFDMKLSMGMVYLQSATTTNTYNTFNNVADVTSAGSNRDARNGVSNRQGETALNIPVFFGTLIKNPIHKNTQDAASTIQSAYTLSKHASLEMAEASMKILGNPRMLSNVNRNTSPEAIKQSSAPSNTAGQSTTVSTDEALPNWSIIPSFAKVHIMMPRNNDDKSLFAGGGADNGTKSNNYAIDFWFQGYYYIYGIEHIFESGEFYQTLSMLGLPQKGAFASTKNTTTDTTPTPDLQTRVLACYNNDIPCAPSQGRKPTALPAPVPKGGPRVEAPIVPDTIPSVIDQALGKGYQPPSLSISGALTDKLGTVSLPKDQLSQLDSATINSDKISSGELGSKINGWNEIKDPTIKQAIKNSADKYGVDVGLMAQICSVESGFDPIAVSSTGATGLFQMTEAAWTDFGTGGLENRTNIQANADAGAKLIAKNQRILTGQLGRPPTAGEIYLSFNQGLGGAKQINRACEQKDESLIQGPLDGSRPIGKNGKRISTVRSNMKAQGSKVGWQNACQFKAWAESFVTKGLKSGISYVPDIMPAQAVTKTNNAAIGATKHCESEEELNKNPTKDNCQQTAVSKKAEQKIEPNNASGPTSRPARPGVDLTK